MVQLLLDKKLHLVRIHPLYITYNLYDIRYVFNNSESENMRKLIC